MPRSIPTSLLVPISALLFHIAVAQPSVEKVLRCPCIFSISRTRDKSLNNHQDTFDLLISRTPTRHVDKTTNLHPNLSTFSRRRLSITDATHSDGIFHHFQQFNISKTGLFRVSVVHNSASNHHPPRYLLQQRFTSRQYVCPVMLDADIPQYGYHFAAHFSKPTVRKPPKAEKEPPHSMRHFKTPPRFQQRIVGGLYAADTLMPYLVNIYNPDRTTVCSGTLISDLWVVTAAHCQLSGSDVYIMSSAIQFTDVNDGKPIGIKRVIRHPEYVLGNPGADPNDIALLELTESVDRFKVGYMPINFDTSVVKDGAYVRLAGYGRISSDDTVPDLAPLSLRQVDAPISDFKECRQMYREKLSSVIKLSRKHHFCAGYIGDGGCDGCLGDSGGAVIMYYYKQPVLVGVITGAVSCGELGIPGVNVNIASHRDFLISSGAKFTEFKSLMHPVYSKCEKGQRLEMRVRSTGRCKTCGRHYRSSGGATMKCRKCPETMMRDPDNGNSCSCKGILGRGLRRNGLCELCPKGSYSEVGHEHCRKCPPGSFSNGVGRGSCKRCDGAPKGATSCSS